MSRPFQVGEWLVQPERYQLENNGQKVRIEPRVMQVLTYLAEHGGEVVSREQIIEEVWEGSFVTDEVLTSAIRKLRRALGDDAKEPQFVQTVPGKGYRLNISISFVAEDSTKETAVPPQKKSLLSWMGAAVALTASFSMTVGYVLTRPESGKIRTSPIDATLTRLTSQTDQWAELPSLSPDGQFFAFAGITAGNYDIYLLRVGGQNAINLTENSKADEASPAFSPDGSQIAFISDRDGEGIYVMGATGENVKRVTDYGFNPAWSPDGKTIVFSTVMVYASLRSSSGPLGQIHTVDLETGSIQTIDVEGDAVMPHWSPHGHRIAFWSSSLSRSNQRDIWTVSPSGGEAVAVTQDEYTDWNPVWSPDGQYIYFSSDRGGTMSLWRIAVHEETGIPRGDPELVTTTMDAEIRHISISGDGRKLAYSAFAETSHLFQIPFDPDSESVAGEPVLIRQGSRRPRAPTLSPDGEWLTFWINPIGREGNIALMRPDGTDFRMLTSDEKKSNVHPRWSPDGRRIGFISNRGGSLEIWTVRPDGSGLKQLTQTPYRITHCIWSPDGSRLAYYSFDGDTFVIDSETSWQEQTPQKLPPLNEGIFVLSSWSPDGRWLAGHSGGGRRGRIITLYSLASSQYEVLPVKGYSPQWLSDSKRLLYLDFGKIHLLDTESRNFHEVFSTSPNWIFSPAISGDDRAIYFEREKKESSIWMLTLTGEN